MVGSLSLAIDTRYNFVAIFVSNLYLFDSIFSIIIWMYDFDEEWIKDNFTVIIAVIAKRKRCFIG